MLTMNVLTANGRDAPAACWPRLQICESTSVYRRTSPLPREA